MVTLGIDLAAEPKATAGCEIEWLDDRAVVRWVSTGLRDDDLLQRAKRASLVGIDAPFGWPTFFVDAITAHHTGRPWPIAEWEQMSRRRLRLRVTDERVHAETGITPLSVSSDMIAIPATRCALIIDRLGVKDRSGDGRVQEVYPAAALKLWGLPHRGYKGRENAAALVDLFAALREQIPWLAIAENEARECAGCDHAFDALVASLIARAAALGLTMRPTAEELPAACVEGWIALPSKGSLKVLARATS
jgi:predicted nuclease with RNAse H fold